MSAHNLDTMAAPLPGTTTVDEKPGFVTTLLDQIKDIFAYGRAVAMVVQGPPQRRQAHDDDAPVLIHPFCIGSVIALGRGEPPYRGREKLTGAVIEAPDGIWLLVRP